MSGAEALLERHAEHKSEIDARYIFGVLIFNLFLVKFDLPFFLPQVSIFLVD